MEDQTLPIKECPSRSFEARAGPPSSIFGASRGQIDKQLAQQGESENPLNVLGVTSVIGFSYRYSPHFEPPQPSKLLFAPARSPQNHSADSGNRETERSRFNDGARTDADGPAVRRPRDHSKVQTTRNDGDDVVRRRGKKSTETVVIVCGESAFGNLL